MAQDAPSTPAAPGFFLPANPVAAAYVLGRLSNKELIAAPRGEFVYTALLERAGLERKYRLEALEGLAKLRHSTGLAQLLAGLTDLDKKGETGTNVVRELGGLLLQAKPEELAAQRPVLETLATEAQLPLTRELADAGLLTAGLPIDQLWQRAAARPEQLADLVRAIPWLRPPAQRAPFYPRLEPLLRQPDPAELRQAAMLTLVTIPGHDTATFAALAALAQAGAERATAINALERIPKSSWPTNNLAPLLASLVQYLQQLPPSARTETDGLEAFQCANDLAARLPLDQARAATRTLRALGVRVEVLHTVYEQMRYDRQLLVAEAGQPLVVILENDDAMPHNLTIVTPGALEEIGTTAEKMAPEPDAQGRLYVPASPKVLAATRMLDPGQTAKLSLEAPAQPGDYQYLCTYPGHSRRMTGTLAVVKDVEAYLASQATNAQPKLTEWTLAALAPDLAKVGYGRDLEDGRTLFTKLGCAQCHRINGLGNLYGPDLTEVFTRWNHDHAQLLDQILEPSKVIADRYRNYEFELKNGDSLTGMILKEDADTLTIQTGPADNLIQTVKKSDLAERQPQKSSVMPLGLLNLLDKNQIFDLLAFLEAGGNLAAHVHHP